MAEGKLLECPDCRKTAWPHECVRVTSALLPEPDQLAALVECMRTSAQETLEALRRRGFVIARVAKEEQP